MWQGGRRPIWTITATGCKSLYDAAQKVSPSIAEMRALLDVLSMKESLGGKHNLRWIPTWAQWADALTKRDKGLRMKYADWLQRPYAQLHE